MTDQSPKDMFYAARLQYTVLTQAHNFYIDSKLQFEDAEANYNRAVGIYSKAMDKVCETVLNETFDDGTPFSQKDSFKLWTRIQEKLDENSRPD